MVKILLFFLVNGFLDEIKPKFINLLPIVMGYTRNSEYIIASSSVFGNLSTRLDMPILSDFFIKNWKEVERVLSELLKMDTGMYIGCWACLQFSSDGI